MFYKKWLAVTFAAGLLLAAPVQSQVSAPPPPQAANGSRALTAAELAKIKAVLAPYSASRLNSDDAKAIKRALREAGLRRSRELDEALNEAGFSAAKMDALDPPPRRPPADSPPPAK